MERICTRCGEQKSVEDFKWRDSVGRRDNLCRPCRQAYARDHYEKNRETYLARASRRRRQVIDERAAYIAEYVGKKGCADCGERDALVLEFDHLGDKNFTIGAALRDENWGRILQEIDAFDVVCANCHRRRTARRRGTLRYLLSQESG